jgi:uncharacterized DUF497 family protein
MRPLPEYFGELTGFQWDSGNSEKNWLAHGVSRAETEQVFFNRPVLVVHGAGQSDAETRYYVLGRTNAGRDLTIVFTVRGTLVRPILARDMSRRERRLHREEQNDEEAP